THIDYHMQHFSNAGFPCPIMQSPSDHFLRAINSDFDRIITLCKTWQDDHGDLSSVTMDSSVAIRTLEETYKLSADAAAVETMIRRLTEKEGPSLKSKGKASNATRIAVLTWRSLLIMSREWKYYWLRLILYLLLALCIGTLFSGLGHSLTSVGARVGAIFLFISFSSLLSIVGIPAQLKEVKVYASEDSNKHLGAFVFLTSQFFASIPFLFLISISSSLLFCFLMGLRNEFSYLMYFVLNFFMCLLVNEGLVLAFATILQDMFWSISLLAMMMLSAGFFRIRSSLPRTVWMYPVSYIAFHTFSIQGILENEYNGVSFTVGELRTISGYQALENVYDVSPDDHSKWKNLLILSLMAIGYRVLLGEENASKHGRNDSNKIEEFNLFDKISGGTKVFDDTTAAEKDVNAAKPVSTAGDAVTAASVIPDIDNAGPSNVSDVGPSTSTAWDIFEDEMMTIADTLVAIRSTRPKTTLVVIRDVKEEPRRATPVPTVQSQDKGKSKIVEPELTPKNPIKAQIQRDAEIAQRLFEEDQARFEREQRIARERAAEQEAKDVALIEQMEDV
ncbi:ABC transporter G family member 3, partial [Tanacetum coccineum]